MEHEVTVSISLNAPEGDREEMGLEVVNRLRWMTDDVFESSGCYGAFDCYAVMYFPVTVQADDLAAAKAIAHDYLGRAARDAGFEVEPSWWVRVPVDEKTQREIREKIEEFFSQDIPQAA